MNVNVAVPVLPAVSVQLRASEPVAVSGALYVTGLGQLATPLVGSAAVVVSVNAWLYQLLWSAGRSGVFVTDGAVASNLKVKVADALLPALSVQVRTTEP